MAAAENFVRQAYYYYYFLSIWLSQNMKMRSHDSSQLNNLVIKMDTLFPVLDFFTSCIILRPLGISFLCFAMLRY